MPFEFVCPFCGHESWVEDHLRGQQGPCAGCGRLVTLPESPTEVSRLLPEKGGKVGHGGWWLWLTALAVLSLISFFLAISFMPTDLGPAKPLYDSECRNRLRQITIALRAYHRSYGSFPPPVVFGEDGKPMHSWRVLLLGQLEQGGLLDAYDMSVPWDHAKNIQLAAQCPRVYQCPLDDDASLGGLTSYLLVVGPGTAIDYAKTVSLKELTDVAGNRIILVEQCSSDVMWLEPKDAAWRADNLNIGGEHSLLRSRHRDGAHAGFVSGRVELLKPRLSPATLRSLLTVESSSR